ncbi:MAG: 16S rRNA (cytidine(1402)-2'-O)-methyltransferase [Acidobacteria bacterium]|nr:MAG: 16S rRNA (cytidine(1402)-2'-O)-methyltransferase [Acidobacteriota bacterium]
MTDETLPAGLYLVASPIGHLQDVTLRALEVLAHADLLACEDTRHSRRLLDRHGIKARAIPYHAHNEHRQLARLLDELRAGRSVALLTDAGMPGISDPGLLLVRAARAEGIPVIPIPGPSAVITALAAAGLPTAPFTFLGFLPPRAGARRRALSDAASLPHTLVIFEAPHRLGASLADMAEILGSRAAVVCREMTKIHEEFRCGSLPELAAAPPATRERGEITVVIGPPTARTEPAAVSISLAEAWPRALSACGGQRREALRHLARQRGTSRNALYRDLLAAGLLEDSRAP